MRATHFSFSLTAGIIPSINYNIHKFDLSFYKLNAPISDLLITSGA